MNKQQQQQQKSVKPKVGSLKVSKTNKFLISLVETENTNYQY